MSEFRSTCQAPSGPSRSSKVVTECEFAAHGRGRFFAHVKRNGTDAIDFVTKELGRAPDVIASKYAVSGFSIPSGQVFDMPYGVNTDGLAGNGTVVEIDPKDVVGSQPPMRYETLPGEADPPMFDAVAQRRVRAARAG